MLLDAVFRDDGAEETMLSMKLGVREAKDAFASTGAKGTDIDESGGRALPRI